MTNTLSPLVQPLLDLWDHLTLDKRWMEMTEYPGEWHIKWLKNNRLKVEDKYNALWHRFYHEPSLYTTLNDNFMRFSLLAFLERWVTIRQSHQFLKSRFTMPDNNYGALNGVRANGILGAFRGNGWNIFQFVAVHYHALHYANNDPFKYVLFSSLFEIAFYPIDTIRTMYYADVHGNFKNTYDCVTKVIEKGGYRQFYRGVDFKVFYNVLFGMNLWSVYNDSWLKYISVPLWLAGYASLTMKTRLQISGSPLSFQAPNDSDLVLSNLLRREGIRGLYSGFIPFLLLNVFAGYCFPGLLSEDKKRAALDRVVKSAPPVERETKYWA